MASADPSVPVLGIFVGGGSSRMGGRPKGLLVAPDTGEAIVEKLARLGREASMTPVLVGDATPYAGLGAAEALEALSDDPAIDGPLGGLSALLARAGGGPAVAIACDMPYVSGAALGALLAHAADAEVVAPRRAPDGPWEPLFARYDAARVLPKLREAGAEGVRSLQQLFERLDVVVLPSSSAIDAALADWDTPEDVE